jgi:microcystin-dependent protein
MANYVKATNFTAKDGLPTGNSGKIVKGAEIDTEYTAIASAIASKADINSQTLTGTPAAPTASLGTNTTQLATTAFVNASILYAVPAGVITMWSGSIASIPAGWSLCNGSSGTPDLRDRFVVGAGTTYAVNATGGANTVTLDATMIPAHTHSLSASGTTSAVSNDHSHYFSGTTSGQSVTHSHAAYVSDPGHAHQNIISTAGSNPQFRSAGTGGGVIGPTSDTGTTAVGTGISVSIDNANADHNHTYSGTTSGITANHTHTVTVTGTSGSIGGGLAHENRPPYLALAYIMKL